MLFSVRFPSAHVVYPYTSPRRIDRRAIRLVTRCAEPEAKRLNWEQLAQESLDTVLDTWRQQSGSSVVVEALQRADIPAASKTITEVFRTPSAIGFLDPLFEMQFKAEVLSGILTGMRYRGRRDFALLVVWDELRQRILATVQIARDNNTDVLKHFPNKADSYAYISSMAVLPHMRRKGLGRALLSAAEFVAWVWGEGEVTLHVYKENTTALELYSSSGYEQISTPEPWLRLFSNSEILLLRRKW